MKFRSMNSDNAVSSFLPPLWGKDSLPAGQAGMGGLQNNYTPTLVLPHQGGGKKRFGYDSVYLQESFQ